MSLTLALERLAENLPPGFKTWCYQGKERFLSRQSVEGGLLPSAATFRTREEIGGLLSRVAGASGEGLAVILTAQAEACNGEGVDRELAGAFLDHGTTVLLSHSHRRCCMALSHDRSRTSLTVHIDQAMQLLPELCRLNASGKPRYLVVCAPVSRLCPFIGRFNAHGWVTVYVAGTDWRREACRRRIPWYEATAEEFIMRQVDLCVASEESFDERIQAAGPRELAHLRGVSAEAIRSEIVTVGGRLTGVDHPEKMLQGSLQHEK